MDYNTQLLTYNATNRVITNSLINSWEKEKSSIENIILPSVGNSLHRDELDTNWVNSYYNKNGVFSYTPIPNKTYNSRPENYDTDNDGMSDDWEISVFGDLSVTATGDNDGDGYTNIETFLFSLVQ